MHNLRNEFAAALAGGELLLTEGAILERIRRESGLPLHDDLAHTPLIYSEDGRRALTTLWREYIEIACAANCPILICTPTWRANPERLARNHFPGVEKVSADAVLLLQEIRSSFGDFAKRIFIGGLLGCRGDAYKPKEALNVDDAASFHSPQVQALANAGADFLLAATLPAFSEAVGLAQAMADCSCPYLLSFVLRPSGTLLDGTPVADAITQIDRRISPPPSAYLANCTHPLLFEQAMQEAENARPGTRERLIGLQGNTSRRSPEEFDGSATLDGEDPEAFAAFMARVRGRFGTRILGGCCGTDARHIEAIARQCGTETSHPSR